MKKTLLYLIIMSMLVILQSCSDDSNPVVVEENSYSKLRINEICPNNATVIKDETGSAGDWIEIYNNDSEDVNLKGAIIKYSYYDGAVKSEFQYTVPVDAVIPSKGFLVVWCDAKNEGLHTSFDLKTKKGGKVALLDSQENIIHEFDYSDSDIKRDVEDVSVAFWAKEPGLEIWRMFGPGYEWMPTPGQDNHTEIPIP